MGLGFWLMGGPPLRLGPHGCWDLALGSLVSLMVGPGGGCGSGGLDGAVCNSFSEIIFLLDLLFVVVYKICIIVLDEFSLQVD